MSSREAASGLAGVPPRLGGSSRSAQARSSSPSGLTLKRTIADCTNHRIAKGRISGEYISVLTLGSAGRRNSNRLPESSIFRASREFKGHAPRPPRCLFFALALFF